MPSARSDATGAAVTGSTCGVRAGAGPAGAAVGAMGAAGRVGTACAVVAALAYEMGRAGAPVAAAGGGAAFDAVGPGMAGVTPWDAGAEELAGPAGRAGGAAGDATILRWPSTLGGARSSERAWRGASQRSSADRLWAGGWDGPAGRQSRASRVARMSKAVAVAG